MIKALMNGEKVEWCGKELELTWALKEPSIPMYIAGYGPKALAVAGRVADGVIIQLADPVIIEWIMATAREAAEAAGRDPASIGIDTRVTVGIGAEAEWRDTVRFWKSCGVTHLTLGTYSGRGHLRRIQGRTLSDHLEAIRRYWNAVADLL